MFRSFSLTGEQIRAGRAMARVDQAELARRSGVSLETIKRLERIRGVVDANTRTLSAIAEAFVALGIELYSEDGIGVRSHFDAEPRRMPSPPPRRAPEPQAAPLYRLIYHSAFSAGGVRLREVLGEIQQKSAPRNATLDVTGVLLISNGRCLQVLEGPKQAVQQVFGAISADPRHADLRVLESRPVSARQFSDWTLYCGEFVSDAEVLRLEPSLASGLQPELLTPASALGVLSLARELQNAAPRNARQCILNCPLADECLDPMCGQTASLPETLRTAA
jgi:transcriptional regulator with XRE-family HTH domain